MAKKKTTTKKTTKATPAKAANEKPKRVRGVQTEAGEWARPDRDPDLDACGEEYIDAMASETEAKNRKKRKHDEMTGMMRARKLDLYILADNTRIVLVDKGTALRVKHPRKETDEGDKELDF